MMKVLTSAQMAAMDKTAATQYGIPSLTLMENAGRSIAEAALAMLDPGDEIGIICGKGNNGGDGLVAARILHEKGKRVQPFLLGSFQDLKPDPRANLDAASFAGLTVRAVGDSPALQETARALSRCGLIIDAILGTGFTPPVRGLAAEAIDLIKRLGRPVLAVDLPSGLSADSGAVPATCVTADATVTFGLPKIGQFLYPASGKYGRLALADIGFPRLLVERTKASAYLTTADAAAGMLSERPAESHKGTCGHLLLVAGASGMRGAAMLAARGALRGGTGLLTVALPGSAAGTFYLGLPEAMTLPLPENARGSFDESSSDPVLEVLPGKSAVAIGPGISRHPDTERFVLDLLPKLTLPAVVDADGLHAVASSPSVLLDAQADVVLTPHPGELAGLLGITAAEVQEDRVGIARDFSKKYGIILVLKGARSLVATPTGDVHINTTGNPGMAAGGMGDVLTGLIGALIAQGLGPRDAAVLGVYMHGRAGDLAARRIGPRGILAGEVADLLPSVCGELETGNTGDDQRLGRARLIIP